MPMNNACNVDQTEGFPRHIAIVMDGNGRWASEHAQPRLMGHAAGVQALKRCVQGCITHHVEYLTVFAFSSENWRRPADEVNGIMALFVKAIHAELAELTQNSVKVRFIGDRCGLPLEVIEVMQNAEAQIIDSCKLTLCVAINYGGRWDIVEAARKVQLCGDVLTEDSLQQHLATTPYGGEPDLIIRTGGEVRISNFLLWQAAYAELYFTQRLWPDFDERDLLDAMQSYVQRERRFGALSLES